MHHVLKFILQCKTNLLFTINTVIYYLGPPQAVDLKCIPEEILYTECTWTRPYTIEGIKVTSYNVTITKDDKTLNGSLMSENHFSYLSGTYNVSVTAIVEESLEGEVSVTQVNNTEGKLSDVIKKCYVQNIPSNCNSVNEL